MNELKLCKDCNSYGEGGKICKDERSRRLPKINYVHGGERPISEQFYSCNAQRLDSRDCGEVGQWFEQKLGGDKILNK
jgi:hypothetical protein